MPLIDAYGLKGLGLRARSYGPVRLWGSVAFIAANLTGGLLLGVLAPKNLIWLIFAGNCAVATAALCWWPCRAPIGARERGPARRSHLRQPAFLAVAVAGSLIQASHAVYYGFATLDWSAKGYGGLTIGALWALGVAAEIVLFALAPRLPPAIGPLTLIMTGAAGGVLRWSATAFDPPIALLAAAAAPARALVRRDPSRHDDVSQPGRVRRRSRRRTGRRCDRQQLVMAAASCSFRRALRRGRKPCLCGDGRDGRIGGRRVDAPALHGASASAPEGADVAG